MSLHTCRIKYRALSRAHLTKRPKASRSTLHKPYLSRCLTSLDTVLNPGGCSLSQGLQSCDIHIRGASAPGLVNGSNTNMQKQTLEHKSWYSTIVPRSSIRMLRRREAGTPVLRL